MVDYVVLGLILLFAAIGLYRGVVSQVLSLVGIVAAFILAPLWGGLIAPWSQELLGCSRFMAEKASIFVIGVSIYLVCRLIGFFTSKLFVNRIKEFKRINRIGGSVLGATKAIVLIGIVFCFLALLPDDVLKNWFPPLLKSNSFQFAANHNPMGNRSALEQLRHLRSALSDPKKTKKLREDPAIRKLLSKHKLEDAFKDQRFVRMIEDGDYESLRKHEAMEDMMKEDQLEALLAELEKNSS